VAGAVECLLLLEVSMRELPSISWLSIYSSTVRYNNQGYNMRTRQAKRKNDQQYVITRCCAPYKQHGTRSKLD